MEKILAAVDFSNSTDDVLAMAQTMAKAFGASVTIVHTMAPSQVINSFYGVGGPLYVGTVVKEEEKRDEYSLNILKHKLEQADVKADCILLRGPTVDNIVEEAETLPADLIIAGSHHHGLLYDLFVGSVSEQLVRKSPCPILVVPHESKK